MTHEHYGYGMDPVVCAECGVTIDEPSDPINDARPCTRCGEITREGLLDQFGRCEECSPEPLVKPVHDPVRAEREDIARFESARGDDGEHSAFYPHGEEIPR
jgi:DNA-directed RNA polymerase subunit RPC12/RpoP